MKPDDPRTALTLAPADFSNARRGTVVRVRGSVIDAHFTNGVPDLNNELRAGDEGEVVIEVLNHLDANTVRGIALCPTQGLARGSAVVDRGGLPRELNESGELKNAVLVFGQMNDPPGARPSLTLRVTVQPSKPAASARGWGRVRVGTSGRMCC